MTAVTASSRREVNPRGNLRGLLDAAEGASSPRDDRYSLFFPDMAPNVSTWLVSKAPSDKYLRNARKVGSARLEKRARTLQTLKTQRGNRSTTTPSTDDDGTLSGMLRSHTKRHDVGVYVRALSPYQSNRARNAFDEGTVKCLVRDYAWRKLLHKTLQRICSQLVTI